MRYLSGAGEFLWVIRLPLKVMGGGLVLYFLRVETGVKPAACALGAPHVRDCVTLESCHVLFHVVILPIIVN
jgi:hypothetical protein